MKSKRVRDALVALDGQSFNCREAIEDAIFPLFAPLQEVFPGESHRDLVDRLIRARWLEVAKGNWQLTLPDPNKFPGIIESESAIESQPTTPAYDVSMGKNNAMAAILRDDYKEAIRILTTLL
jgi:hypothetical protein